MRTEKEMFDLILGQAKRDERIRAVYMNGSRTNSNVPKDKYQDYDIVYVVTETESFIKDRSWIDELGEILIMQEPDSNDCAWGANMDPSRSYGFLMIFTDGNRIDLHVEIADETVFDDKLTIILLDKDGILPTLPPPTDIDYHVKHPTKEQFRGQCNEFWWCLNNMAKGIARDELPYVMHMYGYVRTPLEHMLDWYIGIDTDFSVSPGKSGKFYKKYLPKDMYDAYLKTYCEANADAIWDSIYTACKLFSDTARKVADALGFSYVAEEEKGIYEYMRMVREDLL